MLSYDAIKKNLDAARDELNNWRNEYTKASIAARSAIDETEKSNAENFMQSCNSKILTCEIRVSEYESQLADVAKKEGK
jgi:hypothetical protein